ncbi:ABC transporter ATP-binding protein [Aureimonas fodinaquatilis]|uniref:ABC transporter ATP-binding protein n=1 Tax=Aureimonas fodinaquatilis TaxID=2565783 RepID=A0A5B0DZH9_9HYPH|nr:ABC transporter ATP-binding protein [Aureimonas fodinaquatilis]KAA0971846.1 ABC transporter ATP-binding protein [Aureimonas fodinaquatilis]
MNPQSFGSERNDALVIHQLVKQFGAFKAVNNISISVPSGSFLVLVGPSGCGKSTLLRMLAGLESPTEGEIVFDGKVVSSGTDGTLRDSASRNAGLVFQSYALWPHMTVAANVEWPLKVAKWSKAERAARVDEVLGLLNISELRDRYPAEISGGQQQRVAIARTIGPRPSILLLDEPLSNLDAKLRVEMRSELMRIHRATGATSVYVTHDQVEAMTMASHVAVLNKGRVEQFGPPVELLQNPQTTFVATFLGTPAANLIPATQQSGAFVYEGQPIARIPVNFSEKSVKLLYRAQDIGVGAIEGRPQIFGKFAEAAPIAGQSMVTAIVGDMRVTGMTDGYFTAVPGSDITMSLLREPDGIFNEAGQRIVL